MADQKPSKLPRRRKTETVRERASKAKQEKGKVGRRRKLGNAASKPAGKLKRALTTNIETHKHDDANRYKSFFTKSRSLTPGYLKGAFAEIRQVSWPTFNEAIRLTGAVFVFAVAFAVLVAGLDWLLDKAFQEVILNESQNIKEFLNL